MLCSLAYCYSFGNDAWRTDWLSGQYQNRFMMMLKLPLVVLCAIFTTSLNDVENKFMWILCHAKTNHCCANRNSSYNGVNKDLIFSKNRFPLWTKCVPWWKNRGSKKLSRPNFFSAFISSKDKYLLGSYPARFFGQGSKKSNSHSDEHCTGSGIRVLWSEMVRAR